MIRTYTIPSGPDMANYVMNTPGYMAMSAQPSAVVYEEYLSDEDCDAAIDRMMSYEPYELEHCGAITREALSPLATELDPIKHAAFQANGMHFGFDIINNPAAWLQTYTKGGDYDPHVDGAPGQARKLTAVAMLSKPGRYDGGDLIMDIYNELHTIPRTRGTIVVFPPWQIHMVTPVTSGLRQTINMGFWGPPFK